MLTGLYLAWILSLAGNFQLPSSTAPEATQDHRPPAWAILNRPSDAPLNVPGFGRLYSTLQKDRTVRVIVRLKEPRHLTAGIGTGGDQAGPQAVTKGDLLFGGRREEVLQRLSKRAAGTAKKFDFIPFMAVEADEYDFHMLLNSPEIDHVQEDIAVPPFLSQSVPLIGADGEGTFSGFSGSGIAVAILDTGVDRSHPFFGGRVVEEACYSTTSGSTVLSTCPNGQDSQTGVGSGVNCDDSPAGCYHGTHVAGIAAGNTTGLSGVAKNASIISIQIFSKFLSDASCGGQGMAPCVLSYTSDQILGLQRVYELRNQYGIAAVNMSLGGGLYSSYCDSGNEAIKAAIDNLRSVGIATVIASGNSGSSSRISYPACISSAISVGSTTKDDAISSYSNSASILKLLAPGSSVYSSFPGGIYGNLSGTSMAAPHVAGAWAVLKSVKPSATVDEILNALTSTGVPVTDTRNGLTKPRIKVDAALLSLTQPTKILWRNSDGRLLLWNMEDSTFTGSTLLNNGTAVNTAWTVVGTGDFNNDGNIDILWRHTDGRLLAWFMEGTTLVRSFLLNNKTPVNTVWIVAGTGDFNGDGKVDILWRHTDGRLLVWFMDGITLVRSFLLNSGTPVSTAWAVVGTGDFNGDGKVDILWRHTDGRLLAWFMDGTTFVRSFLMNNKTPVNTAWSVVGTADFMGDGNVDILWRHTDGRLLIWFMSGTTLLHSQLLNGGTPVNLVWSVVGAYVP